jgi:hexosaminidase
MKAFAILILLLASTAAIAQDISIIPQPAYLDAKQGTFALGDKTVLVVRDKLDQKAADFLNDYLEQFYGMKLEVRKRARTNFISLSTRQAKDAGQGAYTLLVTGKGITIEGDSYPGTFYGMQSLIQLLPVPPSPAHRPGNRLQIPLVNIRDAPRFAYRGMHLDVGRHFFPVSFIKKYIDYLAFHKMNTFHWHLTEDQGWRIEIKKYPKLTEVGAWRDGTIIGRYPGTGNDSTRYGGFYTQEEAKEIVRYAADRYITVIPEIEMPGHSSAALAAYPELGCPGTGPYKVEQTWGIFDDIYCAGKDSTFTFLQDVLDEIMAIFPSKFIHVGGDESPKANWRNCSLCQQRIRNEGLKDEHELQSYFIQRMEQYINSKGRTIIGWDEILEGGLAPNAIVMSWRGEEGGIEAARQAHQVIMTPGPFVYLDHSQSLYEDSVTIGGFTTVEKIYGYEPVPKELSAEQANYIMGAQGNVWTEYMRYPAKVEYQIFPRMSALSEVQWSPKEARNWTSFENRLYTQFRRYDLWGTNYSKAFFDIKVNLKPAPDKNGVAVELAGRSKEGKLLYSMDRQPEAQVYTAPIVVRTSTDITGMYYQDGQLLDSLVLNINVSKATGKNITLKDPPSTYFPGNGAFTLVDGIINEKGGRTQQSAGFQTNVDAVIDLDTSQLIRTVMVHALRVGGTYVYPPQALQVYGSADGKTYEQLGSTKTFTQAGEKAIMRIDFSPKKTRYVRVVVERLEAVPEGRPGVGEKTWLFVDEIEIH